jgi:hypothetical protein
MSAQKRKEQENKTRESDAERASLDPYTGEPEPLAGNAKKVTEVVPVDTGNREGEDFLLEEETPLDKVAADAESDAISEQMSRYTADEDVEETLKKK